MDIAWCPSSFAKLIEISTRILVLVGLVSLWMYIYSCLGVDAFLILFTTGASIFTNNDLPLIFFGISQGYYILKMFRIQTHPTYALFVG